MTRSVLDVWNIALSEVGGRGNISATDENTREANVLRRHYTTVRDSVQEASWWSPCKQTSRLALLSERQADANWSPRDPDDGMQFAYTLPNDYLRAWYLLHGEHFRLSQIDGEAALHTNAEDAVLVYAKVVSDPANWTVPLYNATWKSLAAAIARPLRGDQNLAARLYQEAMVTVDQSRADAANAESNQYEHVPDWIVARHSDSQVTTRYLYPFSTLWSYAPTQQSRAHNYNTIRR